MGIVTPRARLVAYCLVSFAFALSLAACGQEQSQVIQLAAPSAQGAVPTSIAASAQQPAAEGRDQATPSPVSNSVVASPSAGSSTAPMTAVAGAHALSSGSRLQIPSIGVDAPLVTMGVDSSGVMQVPDNGTDVAWYSFSAVPGTAGNAVLSGHVDTATSYTAVFTRLKELKAGAAMDVIENGKKSDFEVFWSKAWPDAAAPLPLILGNAPSATLTLITCAGTFDRAARNYTERLVVRAKAPGSI